MNRILQNITLALVLYTSVVIPANAQTYAREKLQMSSTKIIGTMLDCARESNFDKAKTTINYLAPLLESWKANYSFDGKKQVVDCIDAGSDQEIFISIYQLAYIDIADIHNSIRSEVRVTAQNRQKIKALVTIAYGDYLLLSDYISETLKGEESDREIKLLFKQVTKLTEQAVKRGSSTMSYNVNILSTLKSLDEKLVMLEPKFNLGN